MRTLGIVFLCLLALFLGGCAVTAMIFIPKNGTLFPVVALIAGAFCLACVLGIRALNRGRTARPDLLKDKPGPSE